jgi:hypothetical protein
MRQSGKKNTLTHKIQSDQKQTVSQKNQFSKALKINLYSSVEKKITGHLIIQEVSVPNSSCLFLVLPMFLTENQTPMYKHAALILRVANT